MARTALRGVVAAVLLTIAGVVAVSARQGAAPPSPDVAAALRRGEAALQSKNYEAALDAFTTANQLQNKSSALALYGMGRAFHGLSAWKSEADACAEALRFVGDDKKLAAQIHNQRGLAFVQLAQKATDKALRDAEAEFRAVLVQTETMPVVWYNLGIALLKQNRDPEGIAALQAFVDTGLRTADVENARRMIENPRRAREVFAPEFSVKSLEGEDIQLKDLQGKVVLIDFWATWCGPCVAATPMLAEVARTRTKDSRFIILSISDEAPSEAQKIRDFIGKYHITWPMIHDPSRRVNALYEVRSIPTYVVIDSEGIIRERLSGYSSETRGRLDGAITNALRAMGKK